MFDMITILCWVTLSLANTNDYVFTDPGTTNIVGRGMGPAGEYVVPRVEDIAFLREAYSERDNLLYGRDERQRHTPELIPKGHVVSEGHFMKEMFLGSFADAAFYPSFGNWKIGYVKWGLRHGGAFVSSGFAPKSARYETDQDYNVNGISTSDNNIEAFVKQSDAVAMCDISTNTWLRGVLSRARIMCSYSNVCVDAKCLYKALDDIRDNQIAQTEEIDECEIAGNYEGGRSQKSYSYHTRDGEVKYAEYADGYSLLTNCTYSMSTNVVTKNEEQMQLKVLVAKKKTMPYTYKYNDYEEPKKFRQIGLDPYNGDYYRRDTSRMSGKPVVEGEFFEIATNYVTRADVFVVLRMKVQYIERYMGATSETGTTTRVKHYVLTKNVQANVIEGSAKWRVDFDIAKEIHPFFEDHWVYDVDWPVIDVLLEENSDTLPPIEIDAWHEKEILIDGMDVGLYFSFKPIFKARVVD